MCGAFHSRMSLHGLVGEGSRIKRVREVTPGWIWSCPLCSAGHSEVRFSAQSSWVLVFMFIFQHGNGTVKEERELLTSILFNNGR